MTNKEAITIMQVYKEELSNRTDFGDIGLRALMSMQIEAFELAIKALSELSVDETKEYGIYTRIYANDEPSVKAEKLYQICDGPEMKSVAEYLKEIFPLEDRPQGAWIAEGDGYSEDGIVYDTWHCSKCDHCEDGEYLALPNYCPECGADMRGKDNER